MTGPDTAIFDSIQKAHRALQAARLLLANADTEGACNRAYYAMFHAAHAALWAAGAQPLGAVIKSHGGLISLFGQRLVKTDRIAAEQGRAFGRVEKMRLLADYTADAPVDANAQEALALAEAFVRAIELMLPA